jgi:FtsP/CotA-like multicopper oxidase with cupredoxin domain
LLNLQFQSPLRAAEARPFGVVALADRAHVDAANASNGATVYPGDALDTAGGGTLRLTIGKGQVYLLSDSAANLGQNAGVLSASVLRGTVGFSSLTAQEFQLDTPEGVVHATNGLPAFGQVTLTGPKELTVTAFKGTLLLERNDQKLTIQAGQTYDVALVPNDANEPAQGAAGVKSAYNQHLVWRLIVIGVAAGVGYWLWQHFSESPVDPK